jgi:hypothetical protein
MSRLQEIAAKKKENEFETKIVVSAQRVLDANNPDEYMYQKFSKAISKARANFLSGNWTAQESATFLHSTVQTLIG